MNVEGRLIALTRGQNKFYNTYNEKMYQLFITLSIISQVLIEITFPREFFALTTKFQPLSHD